MPNVPTGNAIVSMKNTGFKPLSKERQREEPDIKGFTPVPYFKAYSTQLGANARNAMRGVKEDAEWGDIFLLGANATQVKSTDYFFLIDDVTAYCEKKGSKIDSPIIKSSNVAWDKDVAKLKVTAILLWLRFEENGEKACALVNAQFAGGMTNLRASLKEAQNQCLDEALCKTHGVWDTIPENINFVRFGVQVTGIHVKPKGSDGEGWTGANCSIKPLPLGDDEKDGQIFSLIGAALGNESAVKYLTEQIARADLEYGPGSPVYVSAKDADDADDSDSGEADE